MTHCVLKLGLAFVSLMSLAPVVSADNSADEQEYLAAIADRSAKIVQKLDLRDAQQEERVAALVANQYQALRDIHDARDAQLAEIESNPESESSKSQRHRIETDANLLVQAAHRKFVARLGAELTCEDVSRIKDGMTYGVVPNTYEVYQQLLPDLSEQEQREILANLLEARDYAMDAGSSDEKHAWFGKYKGRINNYLSDRGYDLKQAEKDLAARRQIEQQTKDAEAAKSQ